MRNLDRYLGLPGIVRHGLIEPFVERLPEGRTGRARNTFRMAKRFVRMADGDLARAWKRSLASRPAYDGPILADGLEEVRRADASLPDAFDRHWARAAGIEDPVDRVLYMDQKMYLPNQLLLIQDKMSMAVSLEARVPFLDYRLVELAATIPAAAKLRRTELKMLLKRLAERYIPRECIYRTKQGFAPPLEAWLRGPLREPVHDLLSQSRVRDHGVFEAGYVEWLKREFYERHRELTLELYQAFLLETWLDLFVDRRRTQVGPVSAQAG
jgi:asparagine synthase (glutamine-hydrolysing)